MVLKAEAGAQKPIGLDAFGIFEPPSAHQKGGVNAKYPKSSIVNIAAQTISIRIKARVLNLLTPPQRAPTCSYGSGASEALSSFLKCLLLFFVGCYQESTGSPTWVRSAPFQLRLNIGWLDHGWGALALK